MGYGEEKLLMSFFNWSPISRTLFSDSHRSHGVTLPLRNGPKKRVVFSNTTICSGMEMGSGFSKNVWTSEKELVEYQQFCFILTLGLWSIHFHLMVMNLIFFDHSTLPSLVCIWNYHRYQIHLLYHGRKLQTLAEKGVSVSQYTSLLYYQQNDNIFA